MSQDEVDAWEAEVCSQEPPLSDYLETQMAADERYAEWLDEIEGVA